MYTSAREGRRQEDSGVGVQALSNSMGRRPSLPSNLTILVLNVCGTAVAACLCPARSECTHQ